ncbi:MAG: DNA (Cytosine-5-)-methyltransferase family protein [uncultured Sulfurovum sp.]|uniref:DNA (cytosine-5-)-methyltransferase n=1 Tax=uncultured Sulfurovum sp. TaxID=269237 RepID=A0A6S6SDM6_9BACT|nr:MAG: DNA (Cytosine-5-)-methyltransferase family protein [uncultured Sulfurovum sp.]
MAYTIFETFVGAGGAHIGFCENGFVSKYVNDIEPTCLQTLTYNNPKIKKTAYIDNDSILDINPKELLNRTKMKQGELDVFFGGIVCKGFSLAGERSPHDERNYFYHKQIELIEEVQPKISLIENVPGIINAKVLALDTPLEVKEEVDLLWKELENFKGLKAKLRKENYIPQEVEEQGKILRKKKETILKDLENKGYFVSVLEDIYTMYERIGYSVSHKVLNAAWYGSSTKRERIIIVAVRGDIEIGFKFPKPMYMDESLMRNLDKALKVEKYKKPKTVNSALTLINYDNEDDIDNKPMNHAPKTVERFKYIPEGENIAKNIDKLPEHLKISKFYSRGSTMRLHGDKPSPTLVPGHSNFPVHPKAHRSISVREAAMITGFPLDYKFFGSHTKRCEHVGNAVPPQLASALAKSCIDLLRELNEAKHTNGSFLSRSA